MEPLLVVKVTRELKSGHLKGTARLGGSHLVYVVGPAMVRDDAARIMDELSCIRQMSSEMNFTVGR